MLCVSGGCCAPPGGLPLYRCMTHPGRRKIFKNLKIGARLGLGFGLLLALITLMAGIAAWQMGRLANNTSYYQVNLVPSYQAVHEISLALSDIRRFENRHIL